MVFYYFTSVAELRSSAMSGAMDRREDEHVPQFYGRIDEKFAEWETDVRLWQVEFKLEDRDRLGPRQYRRGLHGQPKIMYWCNHSKNVVRTARSYFVCATVNDLRILSMCLSCTREMRTTSDIILLPTLRFSNVRCRPLGKALPQSITLTTCRMV